MRDVEVRTPGALEDGDLWHSLERKDAVGYLLGVTDYCLFSAWEHGHKLTLVQDCLLDLLLQLFDELGLLSCPTLRLFHLQLQHIYLLGQPVVLHSHLPVLLVCLLKSLLIILQFHLRGHHIQGKAEHSQPCGHFKLHLEVVPLIPVCHAYRPVLQLAQRLEKVVDAVEEGLELGVEAVVGVLELSPHLTDGVVGMAGQGCLRGDCQFDAVGVGEEAERLAPTHLL